MGDWMHFTGDISLGQALTFVSFLISAAAAFVRIGRLQTLLERVIKDSEETKKELAHHNETDATTFRQIEATLNHIVGQLQFVVGQTHHLEKHGR